MLDCKTKEERSREVRKIEILPSPADNSTNHTTFGPKLSTHPRPPLVPFFQPYHWLQNQSSTCIGPLVAHLEAKTVQKLSQVPSAAPPGASGRDACHSILTRRPPTIPIYPLQKQPQTSFHNLRSRHKSERDCLRNSVQSFGRLVEGFVVGRRHCWWCCFRGTKCYEQGRRKDREAYWFCRLSVS
jgi:hypothetical protein